MTITRNGVCYDLKKSPYKHTVGNTTYVFSSELHLIKFKDKVGKNRITVNNSLSKRFGLVVDMSALADMVLYRKIETRGFLVYVNEVSVWTSQEVAFVGDSVTVKHSENG